MKVKSILFFMSILFFLSGCNKEAGINKKSKTSTDVKKNEEFTVQSIDTFIEQEINYYAPQSGSVYIVWYTENYALEESVLWNDDTKLIDGLMYVPMIPNGDTFNIHLKVPVGTIVQYNFWITKNKQGHYQDFWDLQSSGKITVIDANPIYKNAIYTKAEKKNSSSFLGKGWLIFLLLIIVYAVLYWIQKKWILVQDSSSKIEKVLFLGLSLAVFHALARAEIINVNLLGIMYNFRIIGKIIRASLSDFLFVAVLVIIFILVLRWLKNSKIRNLVYGIFLFVALFSTLVAFTNITTVVFLGKPFNYQWLYYSDFLGSNEAKTALQENLSASIFVNLISLCLSMLILAHILQIAYRLLTVQKHVKYVTYSLFGLALMVLLILAFKTEETWTKGQSENAITTMVYSTLTANSNSSFFSAEIPNDMEPFNPAHGTRIETPFGSLKEHNVKNVLFIILESAGASYFDGYSGTYQLSPNLNRYASQALMFDQMYAHAPATNRSLVSILGSMYPYLSYKSITQENPDVDHPTLSSVLKNKGYRTSFFSSADLRFQNCKEFLAHRGFDVVEDFSTIKCAEEFKLESSDYVEGNGIDDICLTDRLTSWIDEDTTRNFFSMIWTVQGHYPYFFANQEEDFGVSNYSFNRYLNCMKHDDDLIGKVMQALEDRGLAASTLVVVVGDHGEAFGQHKQFGHGTAIYEENLKVPLYFINSILFHGERKSDIAGMKDLATTALSVIDTDIPKKWQGRDLLNTNSNEAFYFAPWSDYLFGYRINNMKYIFNETQNTVEVYDLNTDSNEKINLFQSISKEELVNARSRVAAWVQFQDKFIKEISKDVD